jgi:hypothetical protein
MFSLETAEGVRSAFRFLDDDLGYEMSVGCIGFQLEDVTNSDSWSRAIVIFNSQPRPRDVRIPTGEWMVFGDNREAGVFPLLRSDVDISKGSVTVAARSALILGEKRELAAETQRLRGK